MNKFLLSTTALTAAFLAGGAFTAQQSFAQTPDCPSNFTGTGNVSNAICNAVGSPIPFTITMHLDEFLVGAGEMGRQTSSINNTPVYANNGGAGHRDVGLNMGGWLRFKIDAPAGSDHYGFNFNLLTNSNQQTTVRGNQRYYAAGVSGNAVAINNSASHSPSQVDRDYLYFKDPMWGEFQGGTTGSPVTSGFPYGAVTYGPPGPALQTLGVNGGIESEVFGDPGPGNMDADIGMMGGGGRGTKATMGIRWISPWVLGPPGHGFRFDIKFSPDGTGHDEGNIKYNNAGASPNPDLGESNPPTQSMARQMLITEMAFTGDYELGPMEVQGGVGLDHGFAKGGDVSGPGTFGTAPTGAAGALGTLGQTNAGHAANADYVQLQTGAAVTWNDSLTIGAEYDNAFKGQYPSNSPAFYCGPSNAAGGCSVTNGARGHTNGNWGASLGIEYDWDRYQVGAWYQYATGQGDFVDVGYEQLQYIGVGGGIRLLKGLKAYAEAMHFDTTNHHSDVAIVNGGCGDVSCHRHESGMLLISGIALDF